MTKTTIASVQGHSDERPLTLLIATAFVQPVSCSQPTPLPTPHKPTVVKVGRAAATTAVPAPTRRSQRKAEAAEPRLAEEPLDEEEYAYLVLHCEVQDTF
jgi:hypothetical protein